MGRGNDWKQNPPGKSRYVSHGLTAGKLPARLAYIKRYASTLRNRIIEQLEAAGREIGIEELAAVQTVMRWERHALLAQRWLFENEATLAPEQKLTFSREIAKASSQRDAALRQLKLNERPDPLDELYGTARTNWLVEAPDGPATGPEPEPDREADQGPQRAGAGRPAAGTADDQPTEGRDDEQ